MFFSNSFSINIYSSFIYKIYLKKISFDKNCFLLFKPIMFDDKPSEIIKIYSSSYNKLNYLFIILNLAIAFSITCVLFL